MKVKGFRKDCLNTEKKNIGNKTFRDKIKEDVSKGHKKIKKITSWTINEGPKQRI